MSTTSAARAHTPARRGRLPCELAAWLLAPAGPAGPAKAGKGSVGGACRGTCAVASGAGGPELSVALARGGRGGGSRVAQRSPVDHSTGVGGSVGSSSTSASSSLAPSSLAPWAPSAWPTQATPRQLACGGGRSRAATSFASRRPRKVRTPLSPSLSPASAPARRWRRSAKPCS